MKCNEEVKSSCFKINYKKGIVQFSEKIFVKKVMSLREFAITVLGIDPISTEIIAMYIGKLGFDTYNKGVFDITFEKKTRKGIKGIIKVVE